VILFNLSGHGHFDLAAYEKYLRGELEDYEYAPDEAALAAARPDLILLDVMLPDVSGFDVCRDIRSSMPEVRCLILTSYDDEQALATAILAGAAGYLLKDIKGNGLIEAIRAVAAGERLIDPATVDRVRNGWTSNADTDPRLRLLSPQERRVLDYVARGLTNRQIGEAMSLAEKTVKNYITAVLGKLGMERRTQAAVFAVTHPTKPGRSSRG